MAGFAVSTMEGWLLMEDGSLKLYLLEQHENTDYDTYDSCVVLARSEEEARLIPPYGGKIRSIFRSWTTAPENVQATLIGVACGDCAQEAGTVICASFNAG